jgi:hypothetical protein
MQAVFSGKVLRKYTVAYYQCRECGFLTTEDPYWLEEAYSRSIADSDTGILQRNLSIADKLAPLLHFCFDRRFPGIDIGAGYGIFVRRMRDLGFDFYWEDKYCENLFARGFEADAAPVERFGLITAFEVLEHIVDPCSFFNDARRKYGGDTFIFTTELYEGPSPPAKDWWYYGFDNGQHISFYRRKTMQVLAGRLGMRFYGTGGFHMFTATPVRNAWAIKLLASPLGWLLLSYVRRRRQSLTVSDHENMAKRIISQ